MDSIDNAILPLLRFQDGLDISISRVSDANAHENFRNYIKRSRSFDRMNSRWDVLDCSSEEELAEYETRFLAGEPVFLYSTMIKFTVYYRQGDYWRSKTESWSGLRIEAFTLSDLVSRGEALVRRINDGKHPDLIEKYGKDHSLIPWSQHG